MPIISLVNYSSPYLPLSLLTCSGFKERYTEGASLLPKMVYKRVRGQTESLPIINFFCPPPRFKKSQNILNLMCTTTRIDPAQLNCHILSLISHNQIVLILGSNQERLSIQEGQVTGASGEHHVLYKKSKLISYFVIKLNFQHTNN